MITAEKKNYEAHKSFYCLEVLIPTLTPVLRPHPHGSRELLVLRAWGCFGDDVLGVVIGVGIVVFHDPPCVMVMALVIAHTNVLRTSFGDPAMMLRYPASRCGLVAVRQCDHRVDPRYRIAVATDTLPPGGL